MNQAILASHLHQFLELRFLQEGPLQNSSPLYHRPDFTLPPITESLAEKGVEIRILSQWENPSLLSWVRELFLSFPMSFVCVDDYLDPRLSRINQEYLQQKRPWLLLPVMETPLFRMKNSSVIIPMVTLRGTI